jgi:uncharacterized membrane protein YqiK
MTVSEIEEKYNKSIAALKSLEQILKSQEASYDTHVSRLSSLKHLADCCAELKRYEVEAIRSAQIAAQVAQQQAQREAQAKSAAEEAARLSQVQLVQPASQQDLEPAKKTKSKKSE